MTEPFTWDMEDGEFDSPYLSWDGSAQQKQTHKPMTQDLLNLDISDADWTEIDGALTTLETKLGAKLLDLTVEQRSRLTKMGDKSESFCRQTLIVGRQNDTKLTSDASADLTTEEADLAALDNLRPRLTRLMSLGEKANDSVLALGSDIMVFCLSLYGLLKAIGAGAGLDALKAEMGARFNRGPRKQTPPSPQNPPQH